ncbi:MAG: hypothetical protein RLZZ08_445 [Pseudomonadota bacterium]
MSGLVKKFMMAGTAVLLASLGTGSAIAQAEGQSGAPDAAQAGGKANGEAVSADTFNIPDNIVILSSANPDMRRATARVNGTIITGTDVEQRVALILAANETQKVPEEEMKRLRLQVLRNLIDETLQIQEAEALKIPVTADEVDATYQRLAGQRFKRSSGDMQGYLKSIGSSVASLKRQIEGEMAWERVLRRNVAPFINVSASEVNELYQRMQAARGKAEYRIAEIYLSATDANREQVKANGDKIVEQLRQGGSFIAYARQFSEASTAAVGGDLGWIKLEQLQNPQLETIAQGLSAGQLVGPVQIPGGYSILYLVDKRQVGMADPRDAVMSLKQISLDFPAGTKPDQARARAAQFSKVVEGIHGCGEAEAASASIGATVVQNDQVPVRSLPEALQPLLLNLNVGQVTPPFGSLEEGVRVLMLCGRDDPQEAAGPDPQQLQSQIEEERVNKRAQRYLRDLRRDAVIEYN